MLATAYASTIGAEDQAPPAQRLQPIGQDALSERFARGQIRSLQAKEHLFCAGDPALHVYSVELGHICIYRMLPDGRRQVVDFAYPGDLIGLGALDEHFDGAQAMERTVVRVVPLTALRELAQCDASHRSAR